MNCSGEPVNQFALVIYIPDPMGRFLDDLRQEVVPSCVPHAHVTILPPRPLATDPLAARKAARSLIRDFPPFELEAGEIEIFRATDVIYIGLARGGDELRTVHEALNTGPLWFAEPFAYHPHITLAQGLSHNQVEPLYRTACRRWADYRGPRSFWAYTAAFVQNTSSNFWLDLEEVALGAVPVAR